MKPLVEPILAPLSSDQSDGPDERTAQFVALTATINPNSEELAQTAAEVQAKVLNENGIVEEVHPPRLAVSIAPTQ